MVSERESERQREVTCSVGLGGVVCFGVLYCILFVSPFPQIGILLRIGRMGVTKYANP